MKTRSMLIKLSKQFPKKIAKKNHDFVGLMVGKLPDEIKQAKWIKEERQRILVEAQKEADDIFFVFFCRRLYGNVFYSADRI